MNPQNRQSKNEAIKNYTIGQNELAGAIGLTSSAVSIAASKLGIQSQRVGKRATFSSSAVRTFLEDRGFTYPKETIAFQMLKGGSTKTSTAFNLAARLNQYGAKVLAIDLDMQGNLTDAFDVEVGNNPVFYHVANREAKISETIINVSENLDLIPSDFENSTLDYLITSQRFNLKNFIASTIEPVKNNYDFIVIDCNPALSSLNISIALASDRVLIPVNPDKFSAKGLRKTIEELERVSENFSTKVDYNLLFTLYDGREATSQKYLIEYTSSYKEKLIPTAISRNADVKNALDQKKTIFDFPKARAREEFDLLARSILGLEAKEGNA